ncbi:hypothetical protein K402DRAFT_399318 [Aulographum hederae CBS 113979]|uniref:Uncharacterized protein n=1 Tax=Aulographum hederae CBS 113979 TaxID=1176131 RepID=A0A6G1HG08_9PEZI|nr:hypothetical protein K402DRAFT_399318 [Aulographum hederae CBS 113979]
MGPLTDDESGLSPRRVTRHLPNLSHEGIDYKTCDVVRTHTKGIPDAYLPTAAYIKSATATEIADQAVNMRGRKWWVKHQRAAFTVIGRDKHDRTIFENFPLEATVKVVFHPKVGEKVVAVYHGDTAVFFARGAEVYRHRKCTECQSAGKACDNQFPCSSCGKTKICQAVEVAAPGPFDLSKTEPRTSPEDRSRATPSPTKALADLSIASPSPSKRRTRKDHYEISESPPKKHNQRRNLSPQREQVPSFDLMLQASPVTAESSFIGPDSSLDLSLPSILSVQDVQTSHDTQDPFIEKSTEILGRIGEGVQERRSEYQIGEHYA